MTWSSDIQNPELRLDGSAAAEHLRIIIDSVDEIEVLISKAVS